jgi:membrane associated rhomboid family serine protease
VTFVAGRIPPYLLDGFVQAGLDVAWQIAGTLAGWVGDEAALVGLVGLTMLAALFFVRERQNQNGASAAAR